MIAQIVRIVKNQEEAERLLAEWRLLPNFMSAYFILPDEENRERLAGIFSCTTETLEQAKRTEAAKNVPSIRYGDDGLTSGQPAHSTVGCLAT